MIGSIVEPFSPTIIFPHPNRYGLEKATENSIEAITVQQDEVKVLELEIIMAKREQSVCFAKYDLAKFEIDLMKNELAQENEKISEN